MLRAGDARRLHREREGIDVDSEDSPSRRPRTLVLYDTTGPWGYLGELYAVQLVNLVSHFGTWRAKPVAEYGAGDARGCGAVIYVGSSYGEPLPRAFLDDALVEERPILWLDENIWQLMERYAFFTERYGWVRGKRDRAPVAAVRYKDTELPRHPAAQPEGLGTFRFIDEGRVTVLAEALRDDGTTLPWAVRSSNLVYVAENPLSYATEADRELMLADLLFDLLAPEAPARHRALVRLEDVSPVSDPDTLRALGTELARRKVPFSVAVYPVHREPGAEEIALRDRPAVVAAIRALLRLGGTIVGHGFTHQYGTTPNPYDGRSGSDYEFFRVDLDEEGQPRLLGPVPGDSRVWASGRIAAAAGEFAVAGLPRPLIFEVPHYAASAEDYLAFASRFQARYDRGLYFSGTLAGGAIDHRRFVSQAFPYVVRDVYGSAVIPENLGHHDTRPPGTAVDGDVAGIVAGARRARVVRDGLASFFYHPYLGVGPLRDIIDGIQEAGYDFVDVSALEAPDAG
jgi:uncharacterized protein YdaL